MGEVDRGTGDSRDRDQAGLGDDFRQKAAERRRTAERAGEKEERELAELELAQMPFRQEAREYVSRIESWCTQLAHALRGGQVPSEHVFIRHAEELRVHGFFGNKKKWVKVPPVTTASGWVVVEERMSSTRYLPNDLSTVDFGVKGILLLETGRMVAYELKDGGVGVQLNYKSVENTPGFHPTRPVWPIKESFFTELPFKASSRRASGYPQDFFSWPSGSSLQEIENGLLSLAERHGLV